jgi:hypothetical protein
MSATELERSAVSGTAPVMTERVARLRRESLEATPAISAERARLMTEYYAQHAGRAASAPALRAGSRTCWRTSRSTSVRAS